MVHELLITLCGALTVIFCAYVVLGIALTWLPMEPGIRKMYTVGWFIAKWPALAYPLSALAAKALTTGHVTFTNVLVSSVVLLAWWYLRTAARPALGAKIKKKMRKTRTVALGAGA